jgi:hypothetical protein
MAKDPDVRSFLTRIGFPQYADAFESNSIGMRELSALTMDDLKELGVASLGHRKTILLEAQGASGDRNQAVVSRATEVEAAGEERTYLVCEVALKDEGLAKVTITSRRAIIGSKTYALQNISAVSLGSNAEELDREHAEAMKSWQKANSPNAKAGLYLFAFISFGYALYQMATRDPLNVSILDSGQVINNSDAGAGVCGILGIVFIVMANQRAVQPVREPTSWAARISAAGSEQDVVRSHDQAKVVEIVKALNEAIVNLSM